MENIDGVEKRRSTDMILGQLLADVGNIRSSQLENEKRQSKSLEVLNDKMDKLSERVSELPCRAQEERIIGIESNCAAVQLDKKTDKRAGISRNWAIAAGVIIAAFNIVMDLIMSSVKAIGK